MTVEGVPTMANVPLDFKKLFEAAPGLFLVVLPNDPTFTIVGVSNAYAEATLTKREEILGRAFFEVFPDNPDDPTATGVQNLHASLRRVLASRTSDSIAVQKYDIRRSPEYGSAFEERYWSPINSPVLDDEGRVQYIIHRVEDVTDFRRLKLLEAEQGRVSHTESIRVDKIEAEIFRRSRDLAEERRRSEEKFQLLAEHITDVFWLTDFPQTRVLYVSPSFGALSGLSAEVNETDIHAWKNLIHPEDSERIKALFESEMPAGRFNVEYRIIRPDGEQRWISDRAFPIRDSRGEIYRVAGVAQDITARIKAEEALRSSEAEFRQVLDSMPQLVWVTRPDGYHEWYNRRWYDYTGTTPEQAIGAGWNDFFHPDDQERAWARWRHSLNTGESYEIEYRCRCHDGSYRWFLGRALPIRDASNRIVRWFGTCTDIEGQKQAEAELQQQWQELERANRELEEFAYVASHDLQEPLRMVNIYTQLLIRRHVGDAPQARQYADIVYQGVNRMETLIHDLLTFSRTIHAEGSPRSTADLSAALAEATSVLSDRIEKSAAVITAPLLPSVNGDTAQMGQVFQNLLSNALKYQQDGTRPEVQISANSDGANWVISVRDNGIGFDPQYAERIFGLFKRLHKNEYPGTGLGLAICRRIIERHGGRIWAESSPGQGSVFHFSLPRGEKK